MAVLAGELYDILASCGPFPPQRPPGISRPGVGNSNSDGGKEEKAKRGKDKQGGNKKAAEI